MKLEEVDAEEIKCLFFESYLNLLDANQFLQVRRKQLSIENNSL